MNIFQTTPLSIEAFHKKAEKIAGTLNRPVRQYTPRVYQLEGLIHEKVTSKRVIYFVSHVITLCMLVALFFHFSFPDDPSMLATIGYTIFSILFLAAVTLIFANFFMLYSLSHTKKPLLWFNREAHMGTFFLCLRSSNDALLSHTFIQQALLRWLGERDTLGEQEVFWMKKAHAQFRGLCQELAQNGDISEQDHFNAVGRYTSTEVIDDNSPEALWKRLQQQAIAVRDQQVLKRDTQVTSEIPSQPLRRL